MTEYHLENDAIVCIVERTPSLRKLSLKNCLAINDVGITALLNLCDSGLEVGNRMNELNEGDAWGMAV